MAFLMNLANVNTLLPFKQVITSMQFEMKPLFIVFLFFSLPLDLEAFILFKFYIPT